MATFGVDDDGGIVTEVSYDKITPQFKPIVEHVLASIVWEFGSELDSVYLYGSVATGRAVVGQSDLDLIIIFKNEPTSPLREALVHLNTQMTKQYASTLREIGLESTFAADVQSAKERYGGLCFLKHLCVCLHGHDLARDVPKYRPSAEVARGFNGDLAQKLDNFRFRLDTATTAEDIRKISRSLAKKIVRTSFSLVMPRAESWTTDLDVAAKTFLRYYPEKAHEMAIVQAWAKSGGCDKVALTETLDIFGRWLAAEFDRIIP